MLTNTNIIKAFFPHIIDDAFVDGLMAHVTESIKALDVSHLRRRKAQRLIEVTACHAVAEIWTLAFGRNYKPIRGWPIATAILLDNPRRAVVELWIGHEYHAEDIPDPIEVFLDGE